MARAVICQVCRKKFDRDKEPFEHTSKGYFHKDCYNLMLKEREKRQTILEYFEQVVPNKKAINYPFLQKQIKQFTDKNMTESGILGTLHYLIEVKKIRLKAETGIAIVPYQYDNARKYYESIAKLDSNIEKVSNKEYIVTVTEQQTNKYKNLIDIEAMFEEENDE